MKDVISLLSKKDPICPVFRARADFRAAREVSQFKLTQLPTQSIVMLKKVSFNSFLDLVDRLKST